MAEQFDVCPKCGSKDIEYGSYEYDDEIWQPQACNKCGFNWQAVYTFSHNENQDGIELDAKGNEIENVILYPSK